MRVVVLVNAVGLVRPEQSTTSLAAALARRGHEVSFAGVGELTWRADETRACAVRRVTRPDLPLEALGPLEELVVGVGDVVLVRTNPARDRERAWAHAAALRWLDQCARAGAVVLNEPVGLARATNKAWHQELPSDLRPRSLITRSLAAVRAFADEEPGPVVLKPLLGTGGASVFLVRKEDRANLAQMVEVIARDDFVIAQRWVAEAEAGDVRLLMLEGRPLEVGGHVAAVARRRAGDDFRSNVSAGGVPTPTRLTPQAREVAERVGPALVERGIFLAGLDVIGDRLVEVNVWSPGGLDDASRFAGVDFSGAVAEAIERRAGALSARPR